MIVQQASSSPIGGSRAQGILGFIKLTKNQLNMRPAPGMPGGPVRVSNRSRTESIGAWQSVDNGSQLGRQGSGRGRFKSQRRGAVLERGRCRYIQS